MPYRLNVIAEPEVRPLIELKVTHEPRISRGIPELDVNLLATLALLVRRRIGDIQETLLRPRAVLEAELAELDLVLQRLNAAQLRL